MERIGKRHLWFFFWGLIVCTPSLLFAQKTPVKVYATISNRIIYSGQRIKLTITISGDFKNVSRPVLPDFTDFTLLSQSPSISRRFSNINGRVSTSYAYSYYLMPKGKGSLTIPSVKVKVDGKVYQTDPLKVEVKDRKSALQNKDNNAKDQPKIFLRLQISDTHPVIGQQLIANIVLYFKQGVQVRSYVPERGWKTAGFWKESLNSQQNPGIHETIINGVRYKKARLMQFALFPTKSGSLTISPYHVQIAVRTVQQMNSPFGNFFGNFNADNHQVKLETKSVNVNVEALPKEDSTRFTGAVGSFEITRTLNATKANVGETLELKTVFKGSGNLPLITKPEYQFPAGMEIYQPQVTSDIDHHNHQISGTKTFSDIIVVRSPGKYTLPSKKVSYYDPQKHKFITETLPAQTVTVSGTAASAIAGNQSSLSTLKPITGLATWVEPGPKILYRYWWFWLGLLIPIAVVSLAYWRKTYVHKMTTNRFFARSKNAASNARLQLDKALEYANRGETKEAYHAIQRALMGFISDRLSLVEAGLSIDAYVSAMKKHKVDGELIKNTRMLLNKCDTINYAPNSSTDLVKSHIRLAESILKKLRKEI